MTAILGATAIAPASMSRIGQQCLAAPGRRRAEESVDAADPGYGVAEAVVVDGVTVSESGRDRMRGRDRE